MAKESATAEASEAKEKLKVLQLAIDKIEKTYGKGTIMRLGDNAIDAIEAISTGSISLDNALGIGGLPKGGHRHCLRGLSASVSRRFA